ncbi:MAG: hypothetical protein JSR46_05335 [Verrucomicrobia bacterium]|nr:hypothetical protein [Verrucomicrobiota bacterium]
MKKFSLRKVSYVVLFGLIIFIGLKVNHIDKRLSDISRPASKFSYEQIKNQFPHNPEWDITYPPDIEQFINMITQQPFYFLGKGYQAVAFGSQDGEYALKFFYQDRFKKVPFWNNPLDYMFNQGFRDKMEERQKHRREIFTSSKMAYLEYPEESGMLYVHLNKTDGEIKRMKLYDNSGMMHSFKGDGTSFVVQRKAEYIQPVIKSLMKKGEVEEAKARIDQIFDLLLGMAKKGFLDSDMALIRNNNIGFVKTRAIYIDIGHITKRSNVDLEKRMNFEFNRRLMPLYGWLKYAYPELADYYNTRKVEILESLKKPAPN